MASATGLRMHGLGYVRREAFQHSQIWGLAIPMRQTSPPFGAVHYQPLVLCDPRRDLAPRVEAKLVEDGAYRAVDRVLRDEQTRTDRASDVRRTGRHVRQRTIRFRHPTHPSNGPTRGVEVECCSSQFLAESSACM